MLHIICRKHVLPHVSSQDTSLLVCMIVNTRCLEVG